MGELVKIDLAEQDLKKHVAAIHIENRLSLLERKMANVLLLNAYPYLLSRETHRILIKDLAAIVGFESNDRDCLKEALVNLMSTVLSWNLIDAKGNEVVWRARPMIMSADLDRNWCIYAYHPDLRPKLFNPEIYARINLGIQRKFTSGYALALYENCLRFRKVGSTGWLPLELFRQLLGIEDNSYYGDFRRLNSKVIKPAIQQVNKTSDIYLEAETKFEKRRIVAVRFAVKDSPQLPLFAAKPEAVTVQPAENNNNQADAELHARLLEFGLREKELSQILKNQDPAYIKANLDIVADMLAKGTIKTTLRAVTLDALNTDYRPQKTPYEAKQDALRQAQGRAQQQRLEDASKAERHEQLRAEFEKHRLDLALQRLTAEERQRLEAEFVRDIIENAQPGYRVLRPIYKKSGLSHSMVQGCFRHFVRERLLQEATEEEFEQFLREHEHHNGI